MDKVYKVKTDLKLKNGEVIPVGSDLVLKEIHAPSRFEIAAGVTVWSEKLNRDIKLSWTGFAVKVLGKKVPSLNTLEKWSNDGIARSIGGAKVEPDGVDSNGFPSWFIVMGII